MVTKSLRLSLRLVAWLVASLAILLAFATWRLSTGPVSIDLLVPYVERGLTAADGQVRTTLDGAEIRIGPGGAPVLAGTGLRVTDQRGIPLIELPEVELAFSVRALLLHQLFAPVMIEVDAPGVVLTRRSGGSVGLRGTTATEEAEFDLGMLAGPILAEPDPDEPLSYVRSVRIDGASITLEDEATGSVLGASRGALVLLREDGRLAGRVELAVERPGHEVQVAGRFRLHEDRDGASVGATVLGLRPADLRLLEDFLPGPAARRLASLPLEGLALDLRLDVDGEIDERGRPPWLDVSLAADRGTVDLPALFPRPLDVARLRLNGRLTPAPFAIDIARLDLGVGGAQLSGGGRVAVGETGPSIALDLRAANVVADDLRALWPLPVEDKARDWVTGNILAGTAPAGEVRIDLKPDDIGRKPVRKAAVTGWFDYRDLTVRYLDELPPITGISGRATFDAQTMTFAVEGGEVGQLRLLGGGVEITGMGIKGRDSTQLEVRTTVEGPLSAALELIDLPPLELAAEAGLDPAAASGTSRTELGIGLPLYDEVNEDDVRVAAESELRDVAFDGLLGLVDVTDGDLDLAASRERLTLAGRLTVAGTVIDLDAEETFGEGRPRASRVTVEGMIGPPVLAELGVAELPLSFEGAARSELTVAETDGRIEVGGRFDLAPARLAFAPLDWRKPLGDPGTLTVDLTVGDDGAVALRRLEFAADDVDLSMGGRLALDPFRVESLDVSRLTFRQQRLSASMQRGEDGNPLIDLSARVLDLRPFLSGPGEGEPDGPDEAAFGQPLTVAVAADSVILDDEAPPLRELDGQVARDRRGWREGALVALLPGGTPVRVSLTPEGRSARLEVVTDDAGGLLNGLDRIRRVEGGRLRLEAAIPDRRSPFVADGTLLVEDFALRDAPVIARLLSVASLQGIGDVLQGDGLFFDRLELPFALEEDVLNLREGRLSGSQLGLTVEGSVDLAQARLDLDGTLVPVYGLNRAIGNIPVIGDFLAGSEGEGAFAVTYAVAGSFQDPAVTVNPLSVLAPGFLRELFAGMREGTLEPPDLPEDRQ